MSRIRTVVRRLRPLLLIALLVAACYGFGTLDPVAARADPWLTDTQRWLLAWTCLAGVAALAWRWRPDP